MTEPGLSSTLFLLYRALPAYRPRASWLGQGWQEVVVATVILWLRLQGQRDGASHCHQRINWCFELLLGNSIPPTELVWILRKERCYCLCPQTSTSTSSKSSPLTDVLIPSLFALCMCPIEFQDFICSPFGSSACFQVFEDALRMWWEVTFHVVISLDNPILASVWYDENKVKQKAWIRLKPIWYWEPVRLQ